MLAHPWSFWLALNTGALFAYWVSNQTIVGLGGLLFPIGASVATAVWGEPWWTLFFGLGVFTIVVLSLIINQPKETAR